MKNPPAQASCCICLKVSNCTTRIWITGTGGFEIEPRTRDNFQYSDVHHGWLCLKCQKTLEDAHKRPQVDASGTGEVQLSFFA